MKQELREMLLFGGFAVALLAFALGIYALLDSNQCKAQWADSGIAARWGFWSGCQLKVSNVWIPAKAYRTFD